MLCPNAGPRVLITGERWVHTHTLTRTGSLYLSGCGCKMRGAAPLVSIITSPAAALPPPPREQWVQRALFLQCLVHICAPRVVLRERRASAPTVYTKKSPLPLLLPLSYGRGSEFWVLETTILERRSPARGDPCNLFLSAWDAQNETTRTWGNRSTKGMHILEFSAFETEFRADKRLVVHRRPHVHNK